MTTWRRIQSVFISAVFSIINMVLFSLVSLFHMILIITLWKSNAAPLDGQHGRLKIQVSRIYPKQRCLLCPPEQTNMTAATVKFLTFIMHTTKHLNCHSSILVAMQWKIHSLLPHITFVVWSISQLGTHRMKNCQYKHCLYCRCKVMSNLSSGKEEKYSFDITIGRDLL